MNARTKWNEAPSPQELWIKAPKVIAETGIRSTALVWTNPLHMNLPENTEAQISAISRVLKGNIEWARKDGHPTTDTVIRNCAHAVLGKLGEDSNVLHRLVQAETTDIATSRVLQILREGK